MHKKVLPRFRRASLMLLRDKVSRLMRVGRSTMAVETLDQNQRAGLCPLRVISGHMQCTRRCPLYPQ